MKILMVGGNGTIGRRVRDHFSKKHELIVAGRSSGDVTVDISDKNSIKKMFEKIGPVDAIISTAGKAVWKEFDLLTDEDFEIGLQNKLMGQVNLVRVGQNYLTNFGSITLTTGILAEDPVEKTTSAALVNGAIHSFVKAVVLETQHKLRVNVVACGMVEDAYEIYKDYFPGHPPVPMDKVVLGYVRSVEGKGNGEIIRIYT